MKSVGPYILAFFFIFYTSYRDFQFRKSVYQHFTKTPASSVYTFQAKKLTDKPKQLQTASVREPETKKTKVSSKQIQKARVPKEATQEEVKKPATFDTATSDLATKPAIETVALVLVGYNCNENVFVQCVAEFSYGDLVKRQPLGNLPSKLEKQAARIFKKSVDRIRLSKGMEVIELNEQNATMLLTNTSGNEQIFTDTLNMINIRQNHSDNTLYSH